MPTKKTLVIELDSENPNGIGFFDTRLYLPANPAEIEDAMQAARFYLSEYRYTGIQLLEMPICPELPAKRFDTASIQEYNALAKEVAKLDEGYQMAVFRALANKLYPPEDNTLVSIRDLMYIAEHVSDYAVAANVRNDEELGELVLEYGMNAKLEELHDEELLDLLSRRAIGEIQRKSDEGVFVDDFYVITEGFHIPDDYEMPQIEEEPYAPIYVKLGTFADFDGSEPKAEWFPLPISEEDKPAIAEKIGAVDFGYVDVLDVHSGITNVNRYILAGGDFDDLNTLAKKYMGMTDLQKVTFKAATEAADPKYISDVMFIADHVDEYHLACFSADEDDFFKEYIAQHLDKHFDRRWLDSLLCKSEGQRLIQALNASMTSYGVVSERGGLLFERVPYDFDKLTVSQTQPDEYDLIEVCGQKGLFVDNREDAMKVPEGCYRYDFRSTGDNEFATLEKDVLVDYSGSVFVKEPIELPEEGYLVLGEDDSPNFFSITMTINEFAEADLDQIETEEMGMGGIS